MKPTIIKSLLMTAALLGTGLTANAQYYNTSLGAGNTNNGSFGLASGGYNTIYGGYGNHALGWSCSIGTGSFNLVTGIQNTLGGNFNLVSGLSNSQSGAFNLVGGQNNFGNGTQNLVFGSFLDDGGLAGSVMLSDANPFGLRTASARFTNITPHTFNGTFNNGYFLFTNDGQGTNPNAGLFVFPRAANTATVSNPAFVGINTNTPVDGIALDVAGGSVRVGSTFIVQPRPNSTGGNNLFIGNDAGNANSTGIQNTFIGNSAGFENTTGFQNTFVGISAGYANTTGVSNAFFGFGAGLRNSTGDSATFIGSGAGFLNTTGSGNVFVGASAGHSNTTAGQNVAIGTAALQTQSFNNGGTAWNSDNVAVGHQALRSNQPTGTTVGVGNTAVGSRSLLANTTGFDNVAVGFESLLANTTGSSNTSIGKRALQSTTTGGANVALGHVALFNLTTGDSNIAIGRGAGLGLTTGSNNIYIGDTISVGAAEANTIRMGSGQARAFLAGVRGAVTGVADAIPVLVDSSGQLGTISSSRRFKEDIADMGDVSDRLRALRPVTFKYREPFANGGKPIQYGLIAEEVAAVFPELAVLDAEGRPETVKYHLLAPLLLNEVQKLEGTVKEKDAAIGALEERLNKLEKLLQGAK